MMSSVCLSVHRGSYSQCLNKQIGSVCNTISQASTKSIPTPTSLPAISHLLNHRRRCQLANQL